MKKWMKAKITRVSAKDGGRSYPMAINKRYCPIIIIEDDFKHSDNWSADIVIEYQYNNYESIAKISYLSEDAPFELMHDGANFELREGAKLVAHGVIYSE